MRNQKKFNEVQSENIDENHTLSNKIKSLKFDLNEATKSLEKAVTASNELKVCCVYTFICHLLQ